MNRRKKKLAAPDSFGIFSAGGQDMAYQRPFIYVREFLSSVWSEKVSVIAAVMLALVIVGLYLFIAPTTYPATAQILIDINRPLTAEEQSIGAATTRFMMGPVIDSKVEIISANRIIRRVIEKTGYGNSIDLTPKRAVGNHAKGRDPAR